MQKNRDTKISNSSQLQMTSVYRRNKKKDKKGTAKRMFGLVLNGILISTTLVSSLAIKSETVKGLDTDQSKSSSIMHREVFNNEETTLKNLQMATDAINTAIKSNQWNVGMFDNLCKSLAKIEGDLAVDGEFKSKADLTKDLIKADVSLLGVDIKIKHKDYEQLQTKRLQAQKSVTRIKEKIGVTDEANKDVVIGALEEGVLRIRNDIKNGNLNGDSLFLVNEGLNRAVRDLKASNILIDNDLKSVFSTVETQLKIVDSYKGINSTVKDINKDIISTLDTVFRLMSVEQGGKNVPHSVILNKEKIRNASGGSNHQVGSELALSQVNVIGRDANVGGRSSVTLSRGAKSGGEHVSDGLEVSKIETAPITKPLAGFAATATDKDLITLDSNVKKLLNTTNYKKLSTKYYTPTSKTWTIKFSNSMGKDTSKIDLSNIKVIDKDGKPQKVSISWHQEIGKAISSKREDVTLNGKDLVIKAPQGGYKEAEVYAIVIDKGVNNFKETTVMSFVTNKSSSHAGIKTKYGTHTYGCKTQAEYDKVMKKLEAEVAKLDDMKLSEFTIRYMNGERYTDYSSGSGEYRQLYNRHSIMGYALTKCSQTDIIKVLKGGIVFSNLLEGQQDPGDGSPSSAYDVLFRGITDCDASSQVQIAILDILGYNTVIVDAGTHAYPIAEIGGKWWDVETDSLRPHGINVSKLVGPTFE